MILRLLKTLKVSSSSYSFTLDKLKLFLILGTFIGAKHDKIKRKENHNDINYFHQRQFFLRSFINFLSSTPSYCHYPSNKDFSSKDSNTSILSSRHIKNYIKHLRQRFVKEHVPSELWWDWESLVEEQLNEKKFDMRYSLSSQQARSSSSISLHNFQHYDCMKQKWIKLLSKFARTPGTRTSLGNRLTLLQGTETLTNLLHAIQHATTRVWIETYIFDGSNVAKRFYEELLKAKSRGVDVILVVDWLGSFDMKTEWLRKMRDDGIDVIVFQNWKLPTFRDHQKLAIIDTVGYCGSANIAYQVGGNDLGGSGHFFDVHLRIEGPAVADLAEVFRSSLKRSRTQCYRPPIPVSPPIPYDENGGVLVQILESNVIHKRRAIQTAYHDSIRLATTSLSAMTGYFFPPWLLSHTLKTVCRNGEVPVSLILSGNSDVPADVLASKFRVEKLLKKVNHNHNLRVWFSENLHCHGKTLLVDGLWAAIGSFNWDSHSGRRNLETVVACFDARFAKQLEALHTRLSTGQNYNAQYSEILNLFPQSTPYQNQDDIQQFYKDAEEAQINIASWKVNELLSQRILMQKDCVKMIEMTKDEMQNLSSLSRAIIHFAAWCVRVSGSPLLDNFDDFDKQAKEFNHFEKWKKIQECAERHFSFGPSISNLELASQTW